MPFKNLGGYVGKLIFESHIYLGFVIYFSNLNFFLPILFLFLQARHQMFSAKQTKIKWVCFFTSTLNSCLFISQHSCHKAIMGHGVCSEIGSWIAKVLHVKTQVYQKIFFQCWSNSTGFQLLIIWDNLYKDKLHSLFLIWFKETF